MNLNTLRLPFSCYSLWALLLISPLSIAQDLDRVDAIYSIEYNGNSGQGKNHLRIQRDQNHYTVNFEVDHLLSNAQQQAHFELNNCKVTPLSYRSTAKAPFKKEQKQQLDFDWVTHQAHYSSTDEQKDFALAPILYDPLSFFFEARCELMAGQHEFSYPLIYKGRQKTHTYQVVGTEQINTGMGTLEALVVERQRSNPKRQTRLYVAPELGYLPIKIEHQESRLLNFSAVLDHMEYQLVAPKKDEGQN